MENDTFLCWFDHDDEEAAEKVSARYPEKAAEAFVMKNDEDGSDGSVTTVFVRRLAEKPRKFNVRLRITHEYTAKEVR